MLKVNPKINIIIFVLITLVVGSLASSSTGTDPWYQSLTKSELNPPGYVFGIVWPILYLLMGITAWRTFETIKNLFYIQLFFNAIWSIIFFGFHQIFIALIDLGIILIFIIWLMRIYYHVNRISFLLMIPYLLWSSYALMLNGAIFYLN